MDCCLVIGRYWHGFLWSFIGTSAPRVRVDAPTSGMSDLRFCTVFACLPLAWFGSALGCRSYKSPSLKPGALEASRCLRVCTAEMTKFPTNVAWQNEDPVLRIHMAAACIGRSFANFAEGSARRRAAHFGGVHPVSTRNMLRTLGCLAWVAKLEKATLGRLGSRVLILACLRSTLQQRTGFQGQLGHCSYCLELALMALICVNGQARRQLFDRSQRDLHV